MAMNPNLQDFDFLDNSVREPIDSENASYVKSEIRKKIRRSAVVVCLIGNGTAWREWVDWELGVGREYGKGLCCVKLRGSHGQVPDLLRELSSPVAQWGVGEIVAAIEEAAARRS